MTTSKHRNPLLDEVKKEFQSFKDRLPNEPQLRKKLDEAFVEEFSKEGQETGMRDAIDGLTTHIAQLDKKFDFIRSNLYEVDLKYGKKFEPEWKKLRQQWRDFLKKSRKSALATQSYVEEFIDVHIKHIQDIKTEQDRQDALLELKGYIEKPDPRGRTFSSHGVNFSSSLTEPSGVLVQLKKDLESFKVTFDTFADEKIGEIEGEVKKLKEKIAEVAKELEEAMELLEEMEELVHLSHNITTAGGVVMVFIHCTPVHIVLTLLELITHIGGSIKIWEYMNNVARLQSKLFQLQADLTHSEKDLETLKAIKAMVDDVPDVTSISSRIDHLDDIWLAVARDAHTLQKALEAGGEIFEAMRDRIVKMKAFYNTISSSLAHYSSGYISNLVDSE